MQLCRYANHLDYMEASHLTGFPLCLFILHRDILYICSLQKAVYFTITPGTNVMQYQVSWDIITCDVMNLGVVRGAFKERTKGVVTVRFPCHGQESLKKELLSSSRAGWDFFFSCGHITGDPHAVNPCFLLQPGPTVSCDDLLMT